MQLSLKNSWVAAACLLGVVLYSNSLRYASPDFISTSVGTAGGCYLFGWFVWWVGKQCMSKERMPEKRFFIFLIAAIGAASSIVPPLLKLTA